MFFFLIMKTPATLSKVQKITMWIIFIQATLAMSGSLYFSTFGDPVKNIFAGNFFPEDDGFVPCELCWFARILMYPLVLLSVLGLIRKDLNIVRYIVVFTMLGIPLEIYHYVLQLFPFAVPSTCTMANPCTALQVHYLGFITIPLLCLTAFSVICAACIVNLRSQKKS